MITNVELNNVTNKYKSIFINTEDSSYSQAYDENSFKVSADGIEISFTVSIVDSTITRLLFDTENLYSNYVLEYKLYKMVGTTLIPDNKLIVVAKEGSVPAPLPTETLTFTISYSNTGFSLTPSVVIDDTKLKVYLETYPLEQYDDFWNARVLLTPTSGTYTASFVIDYIYKIVVEYDNVTSTFFNYIHSKPSVYYTSLYYIKKLSDRYAIKISEYLSEQFDLKLQIWRESKIALEISGVSPGRIRPEQNEISVLNKYVTYKILASVVARNVIDNNLSVNLLEIERKQKDSKKTVLGEFAVTNDTGPSADAINTLQVLNSEISKLESMLRDLYKHLLSETKIKIKVPTHTRRNIDSLPSNFPMLDDSYKQYGIEVI